MNFFTKNLGWFLLFAFFIFMLFVISSNNTTEETKSTTTSSGEVSTSTGEKNLDNLIDMIDEDKTDEEEALFAEKNEEKKQNDITKTGSVLDSSTGSITSSADLSFFEKIFGKKESEDEDTDKDDIVGQEGNSGTGELSMTIEKTTEKPSITIPATSQTLQGKNLMKYGSSKIETQKNNPQVKSEYITHSGNENLPGRNLETYIGKDYEIGVHSLKLNNKSFTETLAYMMNGEKIKQLSLENTYGCFEIEILTSYLSENIGKKGFVCKKYLQEASSLSLNPIKDESQELSSKDIKTTETTKIGNIITIEKSEIRFGKNIQLIAGDSVDQMTDTDINGCFIAHVFQTNVLESKGRVGKICLSDIR